MSRSSVRRSWIGLAFVLALFAALLGGSRTRVEAEASPQLPVLAVSPPPAPQIVPPDRDIVVQLDPSADSWDKVRRQFEKGSFGLRLRGPAGDQWFIPGDATGDFSAASVSHAIAYDPSTATVTAHPGTLQLNTRYQATLAIKGELQARPSAGPGDGSVDPAACCSYSWSFQTAAAPSSSATTITTGTGTTPLPNGGAAQVSVAGSGAVLLATYASNPVAPTASGQVFPTATGFVDLSTLATSISSLTLTVSGANVLYWWTGTAWQVASPQSANGTAASLTISATSSPSLAQLRGTVLAGVPAPAITQLSPGVGAASGGEAVRITGTGFTGATAVQFGTAPVAPIAGQALPAFQVISDSTIEVWSTPAGSGVVDVRVTTAGGTSAQVGADFYIYGAPAPRTVAIPAYVAPSATSGDWNRLDQGASTVGMVVINPNNGPGSGCSAAYLQQIQASQAHGIRVLGYVYTKYANTVIDPLVTPNAYDRTVPNVEADIAAYYACYPTLDGIFFDEGSTACTDVATYYAPLSAYVKGKGGSGITVINAGTSTNECYLGAADILVTFEGPSSSYLSSAPASWTARYPASRFWNLVYSAPDLATLQNVVRQSMSDRAGWIYVTSAASNPWGSIPTDPFWTDELLAVRPAAPLITSITPNNGPPVGATPLTINGDNFSGVSQVCFGATCLTSGFTVDPTRHQISVSAPPGSVGAVDVTVQTNAGTSAVRSADQFTYANPPAAPSLVNGSFTQGISGWTPNCKSWSGQGYTEGAACGTFYAVTSTGLQLNGYGGAGNPYNGVYQIVPATSSAILTGTLTVNSMAECGTDGAVAVSVTLLDARKLPLGPVLNGDPMFGNIVYEHHPYTSGCSPYIYPGTTTAYVQEMQTWTAAAGRQSFTMDVGSIIAGRLPGINPSQVAYVKVQLTDYSDLTAPVVTFTNLALQGGGSAVLNVRDAPYSARGDGTTDDTAAFTGALATLDSRGGGTLYVPPGTYRVRPSSLNVHSGVTILGLGAVLKSTGPGSDLLDIAGTSVTIADLTFDGNFQVPRGLNVNPGSRQVTLTGDVVLNLRQSADPTTGTLYSGAPVGIQVYDNVDTVKIDATTVDNVIADHPEDPAANHRVARGIRVSPNSGQPIATRVTIQNSAVSNVGPKDDGDCIVIQGDPLATYQAAFTVTNSSFVGCHKRAIKIQVGGATITNNTILNAFHGDNFTEAPFTDYTAPKFAYDMYAGISVYASNVSVTGNTITAPRGGTFYNAIELGSSCTVPISQVAIQNNTVRMGGVPPLVGSSLIRTVGVVNGLTITGNTLDNAYNGIWLINGLSGTTISGNTITNVASWRQLVTSGC